MRVVLASLGTRGDMQPFVCLGRALADRGHEVEAVVPRNGEAMVRAAGLGYRPLPFDAQELLRGEAAQRMLAVGRVTAFLRWVYAQQEKYAAATREAFLEATERADLVVCSLFFDPHGQALARARGTAVIPLYLFPHAPSRSYASPLLPQRRLGRLANTRIAHELPMRMSWRLGRDDIVAFHRQLGLPPPGWRDWRRTLVGDAPSLEGYSGALFPAPADWSANLHPVGFLQPWPELRARLGDVGIPAELQSWLDEGPPPVFFGFGSMPVLDGPGMLRTIRASMAALGVRGILAGGLGGLRTEGDEALFVVNEVDHQSLLPRCAAAVHHGGAGTTAASAAAGTPTLVCSVLADQPFWGARCRSLGIGDTLPFVKLDARRLTDGLRSVLAPRVAVRAQAVGRQMAEEDGVAAAVAYLERG